MDHFIFWNKICDPVILCSPDEDVVRCHLFVLVAEREMIRVGFIVLKIGDTVLQPQIPLYMLKWKNVFEVPIRRIRCPTP